MIFNKICTFLLVAGLVFQTAAAAQIKTPDVKRDAPTPEFKEKALQLLSAVARETEQFRLPANRIQAQAIVADLMWEHDERQARAIFQNALAELQKLFADIDLPEGAELSIAEKEKHNAERYALSVLRRDFVMTLSARDPEAALAATAALKTKKTDQYDPIAATEEELLFASSLAKPDADKTYELAKKMLDEKGVDYSFDVAFKKLYKKDPALAARLGKEAVAKFRRSKILTSIYAEKKDGQEATYANVSATSAGQESTDIWKLMAFIDSAAAMNREAARDKDKKLAPVLAAAEMKELVELVANAFLNSPKQPQFSIAPVMPEVTLYAPALAQSIRAKLGAAGVSKLEKEIESNQYYIATKEKSFEELAKDADRAAPDVRDRRYFDAAVKALAENEPEKAQAIASRIKDRKGYEYLFEQINAALPLYKARRGDPEEVRKMLARLKTNREKIATLTELSTAVAARGDRETAKKLLEEAFQMLPAQLRKQSDLESSGKIAAAFSIVAPERAFSIVENSIGQMNDYIASGIRLTEFLGDGWDESEELRIDSMQRPAVKFFPNSVELLKNLARSDFERALSLADKFQRPEIRLFIRLRIAQALLDARAAEKESKEREQYDSEDEMC